MDRKAVSRFAEGEDAVRCAGYWLRFAIAALEQCRIGFMQDGVSVSKQFQVIALLSEASQSRRGAGV
jgi:hypothetical protein